MDRYPVMPAHCGQQHDEELTDGGPGLFFMHFRANGDAIEMAYGPRRALDRIGVVVMLASSVAITAAPVATLVPPHFLHGRRTAPGESGGVSDPAAAKVS
jgi:hypothetical protein